MGIFCQFWGGVWFNAFELKFLWLSFQLQKVAPLFCSFVEVWFINDFWIDASNVVGSYLLVVCFASLVLPFPRFEESLTGLPKLTAGFYLDNKEPLKSEIFTYLQHFM